VEINTEPPNPKGERRVYFKWFVMTVTTLVGLLAVVGVMFKQERLIISWTPFEFRVQIPPRYLQEKSFAKTGHRYLFDELLGWKNIPNFEATTLGNPLSINSMGLRDREYPYAKPPGTRRILVLGDSMTWGLGVGDDDIFTEVLERQYATDGKPVEVINAAVSGWGTDQQLLFLQSEGFKYQPDVVLLNFYLVNDPTDNVSTIRYWMGKPCFMTGSLDQYVLARYSPGPPQENIEGLNELDMSTTLVAGVERSCRERGVRFVLMTCGIFGLPDKFFSEFNRSFRDSMQGRLEQSLGGSNWLSFDVDAGLAASGVTPEQIFEGNIDVHWNAFGHKTVAGLLYDFLEQKLDNSPSANLAPRLN